MDSDSEHSVALELPEQDKQEQWKIVFFDYLNTCHDAVRWRKEMTRAEDDDKSEQIIELLTKLYLRFAKDAVEKYAACSALLESNSYLKYQYKNIFTITHYNNFEIGLGD